MMNRSRLLSGIVLFLWLGQLGSWAQTGWQVVNVGSTLNLQDVHFVNADTGVVVGAGALVLLTTDGGSTWTNISPSAVTVNLNGVFFFDADTGVVVGDNATILRTTDGGASWSAISSGVFDHLLDVSFFGSNGICGGTGQTILYSHDRGATWTVFQTGFFGGGFWGTSMISPTIGFVIGENSIFQPLFGRTINGGTGWTFVSFLLNNNEGREFAVDFTTETTGYVAARVFDGRGAISRTTDGGTNWSTTIFSQALYGLDFPPSGAGLIGYAVGAAGTVLKTIDGGNSWQSQNSGVSATLRSVHFVDANVGYAVGDNGTVLKTTTGGEPPIGLSEGEEAIPGSPYLGQNYPNPFNPVTNVEFGIGNPRQGRGGSQWVTLKIYDLLGREVKTLVDRRLSPGNYTVQWDGTDNAGKPVNSGVYVYRLMVKNNTIGETGVVRSRKMILLR